ncbi:YidH family protein [Nesterenkonia suensis]
MAESTDRGWLESKLLAEGEEPDPRFTLANERTFLAWIRTALAFLAGGIALEAFAADVFADPYRTIISVLTIGVGLLISLGAAARWLHVERSLRRRRPLPMPLIIPVLSFASGVAMAVVILLVVIS